MRNRAVSIVVSYVLVLGIVALLTSALFISMTGLVENQRKQTCRSTLEVVGNTLAADIDAVDRLALASDRSGTVELTTDLPERVAGTPYKIEIGQAGDDGRHEITLRCIDPEASVTVIVRTRTTIETTTVDGGDLEIAYDVQRDTLVVRNE